MSTYQDFFNQYNGVAIDFDQNGSAQCVDLARQYVNDVWNIATSAFYGSQGASNGGASDGFEDYPNSLISGRSDLVTRVSNTPNAFPSQGDIIMWNRNFGNGYGHIAIVDSADVNQFSVYEENATGNNDPVKYSTYANYANVLGWLALIPQAAVPSPIITPIQEPAPTPDPIIPIPVPMQETIPTPLTTITETDKALAIVAKYSTDFPELTQTYVKSRFQIDGTSAGVELILHDICENYKNRAVNLQTDLAKAKSDNATLLLENTQLRNMPILTPIPKVEQVLTPEDKNLINGQDEAKTALTPMLAFLKNQLPTILTSVTIGTVTLTNDQALIATGFILTLISYGYSYFLEILNRKK